MSLFDTTSKSTIFSSKIVNHKNKIGLSYIEPFKNAIVEVKVKSEADLAFARSEHSRLIESRKTPT